MFVFAWILWSVIIIYTMFRLAMLVGVICADEHKTDINPFTSSMSLMIIRVIIRTAVFVFLSILIFGGYL